MKPTAVLCTCVLSVNLFAQKNLNPGIKTLVCGQSISLLNIDPATISSDAEVASSRFTAVSTSQMKGFALFQLN